VTDKMFDSEHLTATSSHHITSESVVRVQRGSNDMFHKTLRGAQEFLGRKGQDSKTWFILYVISRSVSGKVTVGLRYGHGQSKVR